MRDRAEGRVAVGPVHPGLYKRIQLVDWKKQKLTEPKSKNSDSRTQVKCGEKSEQVSGLLEVVQSDT